MIIMREGGDGRIRIIAGRGRNCIGIMMMWIMIRIVVIVEVKGVMTGSAAAATTMSTFHHDLLLNTEITMILVMHPTDHIEQVPAVEATVCLLLHNTEIMMISILNQIDLIGMILLWDLGGITFHLDLHNIEIMMM
jgi:hypothetical protein